MNFFRSIGQWFLRSFSIGPIEMALCIFIFAASVVAERGNGVLSWEQWRAMFWGGAIALPISFAASYLAYTGRIQVWLRWGLQAAALALGTYVFFAADYDILAWTFAVGSLILASFGVLLIAPRLHGANDEEHASYVLHLLGRASLGGIYSLLLFLGVAGAIAAFAALFNLYLGTVIQHLIALISLFLFPALVIGASPEIWEAEQHGFDEDSRLGRATATYLFAPLMVVYIAILYLYLGKVVLTGEWPSNLVSPLVLGAAIMGFLGQVVLGSVWARPNDHPGLSTIFRGFSFAMIIPIILGFVAISMRLKQYGVTPMRYLVAASLTLTMVLVLIDAFRTFRKQTPSILALGAVTALTGLVLGVGPLSAANVTLRSQAARLAALADEAGLRTDGEWIQPEALDQSLQEMRENFDPNDEEYRQQNQYWESVHYTFSQDLDSLRDLVGAERAAKKLAMPVAQLNELAAIRYGGWAGPEQDEDGESFRPVYRYASTPNSVKLASGQLLLPAEAYDRGRESIIPVEGCPDIFLSWKRDESEIELRMRGELIHQTGDLRRHLPADPPSTADEENDYESPEPPFIVQSARKDGVEMVWSGYRGRVKPSTGEILSVGGGQISWLIDEAVYAPHCQPQQADNGSTAVEPADPGPTTDELGQPASVDGQQPNVDESDADANSNL